MNIKGKVHCFFEQSGTFKNEFRKLGYKAEDYDIQNQFGETDNVTDLFKEIEKCYSGTILDEVGMPRKEFKTGWTNKMFVKADLMKHHIKITDVKVERIQSISVDDILCEGVWQFYDNKNLFYVSKNIGYAPDVAFLSAREAFWYLIDNISGKGTWESNPWVIAYSF